VDKGTVVRIKLRSFKDGKMVYLMQRHQIEGRDAPEIARDLVKAFEQHC